MNCKGWIIVKGVVLNCTHLVSKITFPQERGGDRWANAVVVVAAAIVGAIRVWRSESLFS